MYGTEAVFETRETFTWVHLLTVSWHNLLSAPIKRRHFNWHANINFHLRVNKKNVSKGVGAAKVCTSDKYETSTVRKNDIKWLIETYPLEVHWCHNYLWCCFCCVMDSCCGIFNSPLGIILITFSITCIYIIALVAETILFS